MTATPGQDKLSDRDRNRVARFVEAAAGIQCPASKHNLVEGRVRKRQRALGFATIAEYIDFVLEDPRGEAEQIHMLDALTTNKTEFYRERPHFDYLREHLIELLRTRAGATPAPLRLWSAGCSTGEEPYTLAMELSELQLQGPRFDFSILATDISLQCLAHAKAGVYAHARVAGIDLQLRRRYLLRSRDKRRDLVKIAPELRNKIVFEPFNLLQDDYGRIGAFDVIFCRNVMIYFNNEDRARVAAGFARCLRPGGILFLGHSEALVGNQDTLERLRPTTYRRIAPAARSRAS